MISVANPLPEPPDFDEDCRKAGNAWRAGRVNIKRFRNLWSKFQPDLADGFQNRCGWWAMRIADGQVDHYFSTNHHEDLAYEWSNYRYIAGTVNASKKKLDDQVLDPFEVLDGWFEVLLPSMEMVPTGLIPPNLVAKAKLTLKKLHLDKGLKVRRNRRRWYLDFKNAKLTLAGLEDMAPLVASAVKKRLASHQTLP